MRHPALKMSTWESAPCVMRAGACARSYTIHHVFASHSISSQETLRIGLNPFQTVTERAVEVRYAAMRGDLSAETAQRVPVVPRGGR